MLLNKNFWSTDFALCLENPKHNEVQMLIGAIELNAKQILHRINTCVAFERTLLVCTAWGTLELSGTPAVYCHN